MKLRDLAGLGGDIEVAGIAEDSRNITPGDAFVALKGGAQDGLDFVADAAARGAVVVLAEAEVTREVALPVVVIPQLRARLGEFANRLNDQPSRHLRCVGVTGTNGKTSVSYYFASLLHALGEPAGYLGTIGWGRYSDRRDLEQSGLTTASVTQTHARLAALAGDDCCWAAMEVSSHALDQGRVSGVAFEAGVFTNLSRDHLDYHGNMTNYGAAKRKLFDRDLKLGVINIDDSFGAQLAADFADSYEVLTYGRKGGVRWDDLQFGATGVTGEWHTPWGRQSFELPVIGEFSVANAAAALALLCGFGFDLADVVEAQRQLAGVPGRMEFIPLQHGPSVVVDYAHTPDALATVLAALRVQCQQDLVCVFGCGGDRDVGKRPLMAAVAEQAADVLWLTSDNPRSEDPEQILEDMRSGLTGQCCVFECVDRAEAIERAIACAGADDVVLIAGKGHEDYQELASGRVPFSDRDEVRRLLRRRAV